MDPDTAGSLVNSTWHRLRTCYGRDDGCDWSRVATPRWERGNLASRYHLVYPALAYFARIRNDPTVAAPLRPDLDAMYQGLISERCWGYWHTELGETTGAISERNLTYAGRLAMFVGLYLDTYGEPPAPTIEVDGDSLTYSQLSERLWGQMRDSPSHGVSCYHHESMVMCNAVLLINNVIHDRLFGTTYARANAAWLTVVRDQLATDPTHGPLFYYGTHPHSAAPNTDRSSIGLDAWCLFLTSATAPELAREWFNSWHHHIGREHGRAWLLVSPGQHRAEVATTDLATAWAFCVSKELGEIVLADELDTYLRPGAEAGFPVDPYTSGLVALGHELSPGGFHRMITTDFPA